MNNFVGHGTGFTRIHRITSEILIRLRSGLFFKKKGGRAGKLKKDLEINHSPKLLILVHLNF